MDISLSSDLEYLAIFSLVLVLPKVFLRFRIPSGITALCIGVVVNILDPLVQDDVLFRFLSQIGITSLFVFAGLEVEFKELREDRSYLSKYLLKTSIFLFLIAYALSSYFKIPFQESLIFSLAIVTPSAGFIMNSLHSFKMSEDHEYWIKSKAISREIISIILLFIAMQINDLKALSISLIFFMALIYILPKIFRLFFKFISPYAPNSEIPFLVVLSLISGILSKELGAYYLLGAFIVGVVGSQFKEKIFKDDEKMLFTALSSFFNVFLPFYFFYAGLKITLDSFTVNTFVLAAQFFVLFVPLRLFLVHMSFKLFADEITKDVHKISLSLMPNLIFGLVIAGILKERGVLSSELIFSLIIYTLLTSLLPTFLLSFRTVKKV